eukprot:TRINITY_DN10856_c0_g2_i1.p2 TRINITY_DN10856_c0_g2~~TRINITY_DN10856_c0_g2_i1.p2  ORF type:complete len:171 (+),score=1.23 TRINITY_DN10856_c0_g2_i1:498-1010(+)
MQEKHWIFHAKLISQRYAQAWRKQTSNKINCYMYALKIVQTQEEANEKLCMLRNQKLSDVVNKFNCYTYELTIAQNTGSQQKVTHASKQKLKRSYPISLKKITAIYMQQQSFKPRQKLLRSCKYFGATQSTAVQFREKQIPYNLQIKCNKKYAVLKNTKKGIKQIIFLSY